MRDQIPAERIRIDGGTQPRTAISDAIVADYAEAMRGGAELPPLDVFFDGVDYWLADGFHRYHASMRLKKDRIVCELHNGTRRDAVLFSCGANAGHGLRRTNEDKRKAVMTLLGDAEWSRWSDSEIARRCGVAHTFVGDVRRGGRRASVDSSPVLSTSEPRSYTTKHGTEATMQVKNIGKREPDPRDPKILELLQAGKSNEEIMTAIGVRRPDLIARVRRESGLTVMPDRSREAIAQRKKDIREMAERGYSTRQIAAALDVTQETVGNLAAKENISIHADRVIRKLKLHDSTRIIEHIVMDAENLTADVGLIDFDALDASRFTEWIASLKESREKLGAFIRALMKEQQKHGEAA